MDRSFQEKDNPLEKIPRSEILLLHYSEINHQCIRLRL
jgi:hypothetical protein